MGRKPLGLKLGSCAVSQTEEVGVSSIGGAVMWDWILLVCLMYVAYVVANAVVIFN
jgi:hypothetical protein